MICTFPITVGAAESDVVFTDGASGFTVSVESPEAGDTYQLWVTAKGGTETELAGIRDEKDFSDIVRYFDIKEAAGDVISFTVECPEGAFGKYAVRIIRSIQGAETENTYYTYKYVDPTLAADAIEAFMTVSDDAGFAALFTEYMARELFDADNLGVLADADVVNTIGSEFALARDLVLGADNSRFKAVPAEILSCAAGAVTLQALAAGDVKEARAEIAANGEWIEEYLPSDNALEIYMRIFALSQDAYTDADGLRNVLAIARDYSGKKDAEEFIGMFEEIADGISDAEELKNVLDWSAALAAIEGATRTKIETVLKENAELFGISADADDNKGVTIAQIARVFKNEDTADLYGQEAFTEYFDGLVDDLAGDSGKDGGKVSSRGNSSSKGGISKYVTDPVIPADNTETDSNKAGTAVKLPFNDLDGAEWAEEYIRLLYDMEIINGVTADTFEPDRPVTREEYVKMLVAAFNISSDRIMDFNFTDVPLSRWSYPYVKAAYLSGVVNGISHDYFGAEEPVSRQDAAVMLYRTIEINVPDAELTFSDADSIADYAKEAAAALSAAGLMTGMEDGTFVPNGQTTRAQAAAMLGRALSYDGGGM